MSVRYGKSYARIPWKNKTEPALNAINLGKVDSALNEVDNRTIELDSVKLEASEANKMITGFEVDNKTGIITVTYYSGSINSIPTNLNRIETNWDFDKKSQKMIIYLENGETKEVDLSAFITNYEFVDSNTICFQVHEDGSVSADILKGSITEDKLQPNFLADIKLEAAKAEQAKQSAQDADTSAHYYSDLAMSYTNGLSGIREGEETDNAKLYYEGAKAIGQEVNGVKAEIAQLAESVETNVETAVEVKDAALSAAESAAQSEAKAKQSEDSAAQSAATAGESKAAAEQSELNAKASEEAAADSATDADNSALMAKSYSDGKTGIREGEDTDCARFYKEKAEEAAEKAEQVTNISIATPETPGLVKPDGTTITVDEDGTLRGADTVQVDGTTIMKAENVIKLADALKTLIDNSVQQVQGKGLSANDFTDVLLGKLNEIEAQATKVLIADDFDTDEEGFALSARKGKALYYSKIDREDVMDNLLSTDTQKPLSANMGKTLNDKINDVSNGILNRVYPVGSVYISFIYNSPANFIGGTWEQLADAFLYAATSNIGIRGGEASHQLTVNELPSHQHGIPQLEGNTNTAGEHSHKYGSSRDLAAPGGNHGTAFQASGYDTSSSGAHQHTFKTNTSNTGYTGATSAHNNMPPYIMVYMWKRTA